MEGAAHLIERISWCCDVRLFGIIGFRSCRSHLGHIEMTKANEEMVDAAIGARIRSLRLHNGLTQQFLAAELDVSFQQIQKYKRGVNQVSPTRLLRLAAIFGVSASFLLGERSKTSTDRLNSSTALSGRRHAEQNRSPGLPFYARRSNASLADTGSSRLSGSQLRQLLAPGGCPALELVT